MPDRQFPVMLPYHVKARKVWLDEGCPTEVPYHIVELHEEQAQKNHKQTVERLAERGGLDPAELLAVISDCPWQQVREMTLPTVVSLLKLRLQAEGICALRNRGYSTHRFKDNPEEQRFAEAWDAVNSSGQQPVAADFLPYLLTPGDQRFPVEPSERDRRVAATVIQWLGSPVGQGWLRDLGYEKKDGERCTE